MHNDYEVKDVIVPKWYWKRDLICSKTLIMNLKVRVFVSKLK